MAKKDQERHAKDENPRDEDERDEDKAEDEDAPESDRDAVSARPVERKRARPRREVAAREEHADDHDHDDDDHDHDHHGHDDDEEDAYWWSPYAVMAALVLVGILGFVGALNRVAFAVMGKPMPAPAAETSSTPAPMPSHRADARPPMPGHPGPGQQQQQGPRETFGAKHLLVMYKGSKRAPPTIERSQAEAKTRAEEAAKKAKAGAKFEDLVKEYSDEPGAGARGGDLGKFPKGSMVPEFQAGLEKLKVNETSGVVETPFGYHVILRTQ